MTDGHSASLSRCRSPTWGPGLDFYYCRIFAVFMFVGRPSWREDRSVIYSYILLSLSGFSPAKLVTTFYSLIWDSPSLEGLVPVFISPRSKVAQLYLQALGSLFVTSYESQGDRLSTLKFELSCYRRSVGQFVLVSGPLWGAWVYSKILSWERS
jgi:hypothetical protein